MAAASKGHKEVIRVLLNYGADILLTSYEVSCLLTKFLFIIIIAWLPQFHEPYMLYAHLIFMVISAIQHDIGEAILPSNLSII